MEFCDVCGNELHRCANGQYRHEEPMHAGLRGGHNAVFRGSKRWRD